MHNLQAIIIALMFQTLELQLWLIISFKSTAPLKLSAPTSLMQNANTDATLVCHANKPFDDCLWTTPYGKTYSFKPNDPRGSSHENGRLAYFGFADTDCGVIVHNVQARDNGGWLCQLHSHNGGDIFQNATDIVPLFAGKLKY